MLLDVAVGFVRGVIEQLGQLTGVAHTNPDHPAFADSGITGDESVISIDGWVGKLFGLILSDLAGAFSRYHWQPP